MCCSSIQCICSAIYYIITSQTFLNLLLTNCSCQTVTKFITGCCNKILQFLLPHIITNIFCALRNHLHLDWSFYVLLTTNLIIFFVSSITLLLTSQFTPPTCVKVTLSVEIRKQKNSLSLRSQSKPRVTWMIIYILILLAFMVVFIKISSVRFPLSTLALEKLTTI